MDENIEEKIQQLVNDILLSGVDIRSSDCYIVAKKLIELNWEKNND